MKITYVFVARKQDESTNDVQKLTQFLFFLLSRFTKRLFYLFYFFLFMCNMHEHSNMCETIYNLLRYAFNDYVSPTFLYICEGTIMETWMF